MSEVVKPYVGAMRLNYSIARELGLTPRMPMAVYFQRGPQYLLVPNNKYLKRTGVLDSWKTARP